MTVNYVSKQQPNTFLRVWNVLEVAQVRCGLDRDFKSGLGRFLKLILLSTHFRLLFNIFTLLLGKLSMKYERINEEPILVKLEKFHF